jgi:PAS domain S-box-containing protein
MHSAVDLSKLVAAIGDAIIVSDAGGAITLWNPAAERIFGFSACEALGQSLDLIMPERHRQRHWEGYHHTMRTNQTKYGSEVLRVPAMHKDGHALSIAFTVALLHSDEQVPTGVIAVIRDETRRWADERALRARISELEAQRPEAEGSNPKS